MGSLHTYGCAIRDLRLQQGLTQLQLAERASVSERTVRSAEKSQRISCSHASYIADALGVTATQIVRSTTPLSDKNGEEVSDLHRIWEVMFGRRSALSIESALHREIQVHSCGRLADCRGSESPLQNYRGVSECMRYFQMIWDYLDSLSPLQVRMTELCRHQGATAVHGTVSGRSAGGSPTSLRLFSFAIFAEGRVQTLVNHFDSKAGGDSRCARRSIGL